LFLFYNREEKDDLVGVEDSHTVTSTSTQEMTPKGFVNLFRFAQSGSSPEHPLYVMVN